MTDKNKANNWIQDAVKRPGEFTRKAEKRNLSPAEFQETVLANPNKYDERTLKQARLRKTLVAIHKKKK
jgi:hypothetical protein